jgi:SAM-dependent methyltransferase
MRHFHNHLGPNYAAHRRADPRIEALIQGALGPAQRIANIGAGAGSYEPIDRTVIALEPSHVMIQLRPFGAAPVICGSAMTLPFADNAFDAAMAILTIHHWPDREHGLREMKRIAHRCVVLTWVPPAEDFWLTRDYLPHFLEADKELFPPWFVDDPDTISVQPVPIPHDCTDGFLCAYWRRPEAYLDAEARESISTFSRVGDHEEGLNQLRSDLSDGTWHNRNKDLLQKTSMDWGYRLVRLKG